jgi:hypothetical protein
MVSLNGKQQRTFGTESGMDDLQNSGVLFFYFSEAMCDFSFSDINIELFL